MKIYKNILVAMMLLAFSVNANAEDPDGPTSEDPGATPAAPISDYIPVALMAAIGMGYVALRKKAIKD